MTIITKGMGAVLKGIKTLKKSKKFPGPEADNLLLKKYKKMQKENPKGVTSESYATDPRKARIDRTKVTRDRIALQIKEFRKNKGKFVGETTNVPGSLQKSPFFKPGSKVIQRDGSAILLKAGNKKKDLRKFKTQIKTGIRKK
tara:strand:- start:661 stop:1089 length:429 start_codon:yes stop_codon:yes gene_type:complete